MFITNDHYILRNIGDINMLIACEKNDDEKWLYVLNDVGALLWNEINKCISLENLIKKISPYFNEVITSEEKDIIFSFVNDLIDLGLVKEQA